MDRRLVLCYPIGAAHEFEGCSTKLVALLDVVECWTVLSELYVHVESIAELRGSDHSGSAARALAVIPMSLQSDP
jgi:hypothetical protein